MNKHLKIRQVKEDDAEQFVNLQEDLEQSGFMLHEPGEKKRTVESECERLKKINRLEFTNVWVAEMDQQIVGQITAVRGRELRNRHSVYIALGVHSRFRANGIGGSLIDYLSDWAEDSGVLRLELTVIKKNENAVKLYQKKGFEIEGEKVNSLLINNQLENEYYMYKLIN
ncbi:GNAT family N-acetyltransferase [Corticicoccus populi]|uniref:GNAT family N-acetyltransferase n=1 Tax=Corticicoccus populi TaxID=1812821 RepID=A0ABW5WWY7_9STAP